MIFPSYVFLFAFLPVVLGVWFSRAPLRPRLVFLIAASYFFYGWWDYRFTVLMAASTALDYLCGIGIVQAPSDRKRRVFVGLSVAGNLGILAYFKYAGFFLESLNRVLAVLGLEAHLGILSITLPVGISFYTFQSMSYSLDLYRGRAEPAPDFLHFAAYVSMFPQLVAGPIVRYQLMAEQLSQLEGKRVTSAELAYGAWFFVVGLGKKLLIADHLAPAANRLFDGTGPVSAVVGWLGSLAYSLQLYFDFSGYSDMAVGLGLMLGFRFPINFASPYKSKNPAEFWNRWHVSLSHFLRDYLYIPLGGSRGSRLRTLRNLILTMTLGGLWHGAQWTFVAWGLLHGLLLSLHAVLTKVIRVRVPAPVAVGLTFLAVHLGWVLFRAPSFARASEIYAGLVGLGAETGPSVYLVVARLANFLFATGGFSGAIEWGAFIVALLIAFAAPNSHSIRTWHRPAWAAFLGAVLAACLLSLGRETPFLYFRF